MTKWDVFSALLSFAVTVAVLTAAIVQAIQGDWAPAIFFAILWMGFANNVSLQAISKDIKADRIVLRRF